MVAQIAQAKTTRFSLKRREALTGYLFVAPAVLGFLLWYIGPMIYTVWISLHEWDLLSPKEWTGFDNYQRMWNDDLFWKSLRVTAYYVVVSVPLVQIAAFAIAMLLNIRVRGQAVFRTIFYLPTIAPVVAISFLWLWLFNSEFGLVNSLFRTLGFNKVLWLQQTETAMPVLILLAVWGFLGTFMVIYIAGLQGVPQELYEAAALDGARFWHRLKDVTIPMTSPVILFNTILGIVFAIQVFAQPFLITDGGPQNSTLLLPILLYRQAFLFFRMGYAAAIALVLFLIVLVITLIVFRTAGRRVYYEESGQ
jgi:multiple sugar transport system permease protein